jgi:hypothetical protein
MVYLGKLERVTILDCWKTVLPRPAASFAMSIMNLRLGLNPMTLLLAVIVGLVLVISYFYLLSYLLADASPYQGNR